VASVASSSSTDTEGTTSSSCNLAAASYWDLARASLAEHAPDLGERLPGHAGAFETSLIMALHPELVANPLPHRTAEELARTTILSAPFRAERHGFWRSIDGYTDSPDQASAERGQHLLEIIIAAVTTALVSFARLPLVGDDTTEVGKSGDG
jgi:creatinine amidohydrolase